MRASIPNHQWDTFFVALRSFVRYLRTVIPCLEDIASAEAYMNTLTEFFRTFEGSEGSMQSKSFEKLEKVRIAYKKTVKHIN
ncbi:hypothetical protein QJS10_CPA07g00795 [Acorus calamus]|uniref:Uncharacterized protein n=1 Tax=Acorus calamus TaxID=4465 RepID=A0AAV9EF15_ACOCL|nr:hypothetical protein QJS10_CPA07g00795 [Acorus calamus]